MAAAGDAMAELHVVGQIVGAADFTLPSIMCKFAIEAGSSNFRLLQGITSGQTQSDMPLVRTHSAAAASRPARAREKKADA